MNREIEKGHYYNVRIPMNDEFDTYAARVVEVINDDNIEVEVYYWTKYYIKYLEKMVIRKRWFTFKVRAEDFLEEIPYGVVTGGKGLFDEVREY